MIIANHFLPRSEEKTDSVVEEIENCEMIKREKDVTGLCHQGNGWKQYLWPELD